MQGIALTDLVAKDKGSGRSSITGRKSDVIPLRLKLAVLLTVAKLLSQVGAGDQLIACLHCPSNAGADWTSRKMRGCSLSLARQHERLAEERPGYVLKLYLCLSPLSHTIRASGKRASSPCTQWCTTNWNLISHVWRWKSHIFLTSIMANSKRQSALFWSNTIPFSSVRRKITVIIDNPYSFQRLACLSYWQWPRRGHSL